jgi:hypothetical protein
VQQKKGRAGTPKKLPPQEEVRRDDSSAGEGRRRPTGNGARVRTKRRIKGYRTRGMAQQPLSLSPKGFRQILAVALDEVNRNHAL